MLHWLIFCPPSLIFGPPLVLIADSLTVQNSSILWPVNLCISPNGFPASFLITLTHTSSLCLRENKRSVLPGNGVFQRTLKVRFLCCPADQNRWRPARWWWRSPAIRTRSTAAALTIPTATLAFLTLWVKRSPASSHQLPPSLLIIERTSTSPHSH